MVRDSASLTTVWEAVRDYPGQAAAYYEGLLGREYSRQSVRLALRRGVREGKVRIIKDGQARFYVTRKTGLDLAHVLRRD